jgi:hypothetical protein
MNTLPLTRRSLFYPGFYVPMAGLGFLFTPELATRMMFGNGHYDLILLRMSGVLLLGLGILVIQTIRFRLTQLYFTLIGVRIIFCIAWLAFYLMSGDPMFLTILGIVGLGVVLSSMSYLRDL